MGSMISLGVGCLEVDWGKNGALNNHSALFLPTDKRPVPYHYVDEDGAPLEEQRLGFARSLRSVARRLDMLGYPIDACRARYDDVCDEAVRHDEQYRSYLLEEHTELPPYYTAPFIPSFDEYAQMMAKLNVAAIGLPNDNRDGDWDPGKYFPQAILSDPEFQQLDPRLASIGRSDGEFFEAIDPYVTLRLLAENPRNLDELVIWRFIDVLDSGWVQEDQIYQGVPEEDVCLLVTEGSSDGAILRESLPLIVPDLVDFFRFVDMSENYPFTGTGNLVNFAKGLARIRIQNRILIVVDNDTAGNEAFARISKLDLPPRMRVTTLPDLEECRSFPTVGPSGTQSEDINGKAVSIELFLGRPAPEANAGLVRWTSYNRDLDAYQGELVNKEAHVRDFLRAVQRGEQLDLGRLTRLWGHLVAEVSAA